MPLQKVDRFCYLDSIEENIWDRIKELFFTSATVRMKFEPSSISNLAILMSFYFITKFSILSLLHVMNRFTLEQLWNSLGIYFQNKDNWSEIAQKCRASFVRREGPTVPDICKFIATVRESGFIVDA